MKDLIHADADAWLTLHEASAKLGVSAATLRAWADAGRVESYRTPGGHRRFRLDAARTTRETAQPQLAARWRLLENSARGTVELARENSDLGLREPAARAEQRELDRALIQLCVRYLQNEASVEARAAQLGASYAKLNWRFRISTRDALKASSRFRRAFISSVVEFAFGVGEMNPDVLSGWLERTNEIIDRVSEAMLEYCAEEAQTHGKKR